MAFENVDFDFIKDQEGFETTGYVPKDKDGNILGQSGVTIASGFDLGQRNINDLTGLPEELITKLSSYVGLKGKEAAEKAKNLSISKEEGEIINRFAKQQELNKLATAWEKATGQDFNSLPKNKATTIASVAFQYGDLEKKTPNFWNQIINDDWEGAKKNLANFGDDYSSRRKRELEYLNKEVEEPMFSPQEESIEDQIEQKIMQDRNRSFRDKKGLENLIKQQVNKYGDQAMNNSPEMYGRYGDNTMVHMNEDELRGLESLAAQNGTSLTTNPVTGYREAFNLGGVLSAVAPIAAGAMFPGFGASFGLGSGIAAGALTGAGIAALSGNNVLLGGLTGGLGGAGGAGLKGAAGAAGTKANIAKTTAEANLGRMGEQLASQSAYNAAGGSQGMAQTLVGGASPSTSFVPGSGGSLVGMDGGYTGTTISPQIAPTSTAFGSKLAAPTDATIGLGDIAKEYGYGRTALLGAGALAGGLEESDLYPSINADELIDPRLKYDPTRRLSLNMDTGIDEALQRDSGLRLIAQGGHIKKYQMGGIAGIGQPAGPPPEYGIIDVGGKFVKTSDEPGEGLISKSDYKEQYVTTSEGNKTAEGSSSGDMDTINKAAKSGIDPAAALSAMQAVANYNQPSYVDQTYGIETLTNNQGMTLANGGYLETGGMIGDGMSDDIKANINGMQEARLSDGEFVIPADVVSHLGNGSSDAGAKKLYNMMDKVRKARTGNKKQGKQIKAENYMPI